MTTNIPNHRSVPTHFTLDRLGKRNAQSEGSQVEVQAALFELLLQDPESSEFYKELCSVVHRKLSATCVAIFENEIGIGWKLVVSSPGREKLEGDRFDSEGLCNFVSSHGTRASLAPVPIVVHYQPRLRESTSFPLVLTQVGIDGREKKLLAVLFQNMNEVSSSLPSVISIVETCTLFEQQQRQKDEHWKLESLASMVEIVSELESETDLSKTSHKATDLLRKALRCEDVALALLHKNRLRLHSVSGEKIHNQGTKIFDVYEQVCREAICLDWDKVNGIPTRIASRSSPIQEELRTHVGCNWLGVYVIYTLAKECTGVVVVTSQSMDRLETSRIDRFMTAFAPRIGTTMHAKSLATYDPFRWRVMSRICESLWKRSGVVALLFVLLLFCLFTYYPMQYRIRGSCSVEAKSRRYISAPYTGTISAGFVNPGQFVQQGQLIAKMDGRELQLKHTALQAERNKAIRIRELELNSQNVSAAVLSELEIERLTSEIQLLEFQLERLHITSPISGIVLSGEHEKLNDRSVSLGQILYEIAPPSSKSILVDIPAEDRGNVAIGMTCCVWMTGQESTPILGKVTDIRPVSELRGGKNVFVAEIKSEEANFEQLQPGMSGTARIDSVMTTLGWALFHKPWGYLKSYGFAW